MRAVITGAGCVTALGLDWRTNSEGFRLGRTAFRPVTLFDVSRQRVKVAAEVDLPAILPTTRLSRKQIKRLDRSAKLLLLAATEAWNQARWTANGSIPVVLGTTSGGMSLGEAFYRQTTEHPRAARSQPERIAHYQCQRQGQDVCDALGITSPISIISNACASGANAVGHAFELIRTGQCERVIAGGYDALSQLVFSGFDSLQALSPTRCKPFDAHRDGLALGEGAAVFMIESLASAERRHATILGEIAGYGASTDVHHLTQPHPEGAAALAAMNGACRKAGVDATQIDYINAHGTGTPLNDSAEAAAINRFAGAHARSLAVSSTKAGIGHLLGAAGAVEVAICLMAIEGQWLPPTSTIEEPDPAAEFKVVTKPRPAPVNYALSNSFGFGGANASVMLRRWS